MREWVDIFVLCYFIGLNAFYGLLIIFSVFEIARRRASQLPELDASVLAERSTPPISVIAPAFNEEQTIVDSVREIERASCRERGKPCVVGRCDGRSQL